MCSLAESQRAGARKRSKLPIAESWRKALDPDPRHGEGRKPRQGLGLHFQHQRQNSAMRILPSDLSEPQGFPSSVTDNATPRGTCGRKTKDIEDSALAAAKREREKSEGRAYSSTFNVRKTEREAGMQSRLRHEWHSTGEICEVPLIRADMRTWKPSWNAVPKPRASRRKVKTALASRACSMCGGQFVPTRVDACLCGDACKQRSYRLRKQGAAPSLENVGAA
jgi:hypothetical protein